jgi:predicted nucleotidyltransferase
MSGGHFDYIQYRIEEIAEEVKRLIRDNNKIDEWGHANNYSDETLKKFLEAEKTIRTAAKMAQRIDWLVSGDDGEDDFHDRWNEEINGQMPQEVL